MSTRPVRAVEPIYEHKRESIEAHPRVVFAALAVSQFVEDRTGWSIRKFVRTSPSERGRGGGDGRLGVSCLACSAHPRAARFALLRPLPVAAMGL
jgi:hypothetical protein